MIIKKMELCKGRHEIPEAVDGAVFPNNLDPTDIKTMDSIVIKSIGFDLDELHLYVTGLTVALVAVINFCRKMDVKLVLFHYDRESGNYYKQNVY